MKTNWRKIESEADLPEVGKDVLICLPSGTMSVRTLLLTPDGDLYWDSDVDPRWCPAARATHWMPLPEPPEEDNG